MRMLLAILLFASLGAVQAQGQSQDQYQDIRPFQPGSLDDIRAARSDRAFLLGFWSLDCTYCPEEMAMLADIAQQHPELDIVLVATDSPQDRAQVAARLKDLGLSATEAWLFGDAAPERLRFEIDRRWYGELPRTYLFDAAHNATAKSGMLERAALEQWIEDHVQRN